MTPYTISESQFQKEVIDSKIPVLVDFYAEWCQPCKTLGTMLSKIGESRNGSLKIVKLDVMQAQALASTYMVNSLPTVVVFKNGNVVNALQGLHPRKTYDEIIEEL